MKINKPKSTPPVIGLTLVSSEGGTIIFLKEAIKCEKCHRMVMMLMNQGGATYCISCVPASLSK